MVCVNKSLKEFKLLAEYFNEDFAEGLIRAISKEKKIEEGDFYYPSINEAIDFIKRNRETKINSLIQKLQKDPYLSAEEIYNSLKGIIYKLKDKYYIIKGYVGDFKENITIKKFVYDENVKSLKTLQDIFPNIFSLKNIEEKNLIEVEIKDNDYITDDINELETNYIYEAESGDNVFDIPLALLHNQIVESNNNKAFYIYTKLIGNVSNFKVIINTIKKHTGITIEYTKEMKEFDSLNINERNKIIEKYKKSSNTLFEKNKKESIKLLTENKLSENVEYSPSKIIEGRRINRQTKKIWNDIKDLAEKLDLKIKFSADKKMYGYQGLYKTYTGEILINPKLLTDDFNLTETIVHEIIHALTYKIILNVEKNNTEGLTKKQIEAVKNLRKLYNELKSDSTISNIYPLEDIYEFIAHISNKDFAKLLQKRDRTFLEKIIDYIIDILNINNAEELTRKYLKDILSSAEYYLKKEGIVVTKPDEKVEFGKTDKQKIESKIINQITLQSVLDKPEMSKKIGRIIAERLSRRFNVPYKFIKPEDISELEEEIGQSIGDNTKAFWNPNNGIIYFIEGRITEDTPFHEFLHPVIEYIYQYNKPLFNELVADLNKLENPELQKSYSKLDEAEKAEKDAIGVKLKSLKSDIWNNYEGSETDKIKEYLVTVVGLVAADKLKNHGALKYGITSLEEIKHEERKTIRKIYTKILRFVREHLGIYKVKLTEIPKMTVNELADYILAEKEKLDLFDIKPKDSIADADFIRSSKTMGVTIEDIKNKFLDPNLKITDEHYQLSNGTLLDRLTLFIHNNFSKKNKYFKKTPAEYRAASFFRSEGKDPDKEGNVVNYNGKDYTFEELVKQFEIEYKIGTLVGTLYHKIIEWAAKGKDTKSALYEEIIKTKNELENNGVILPLLTDTNNNIDVNKIDEILERLGLIFYGQYSDVYEPEVIVFDEDLGIGTTIDALIRHADGTYSILDFKTGQKFFSDQGIVKELLNYAEDLYHDFPDTKLSRAKLEIAFRAFLLKKNFPSIRFRDLAVAHINRKNIVESFDVELDSALTIIERFYKEKYKNDPDKFKELEKLKLFDSTEYYGSNSLVNDIDIEERLKDKSYEEKIAYVEAKIEILQSQSKMGVRSRSQKEELARLSLYLLQLKNSNEKITEIPEKDLSSFRKLFGSYFDANIPILQSLMKLFRDKKNKAQQKIYEMEAELDHLMEKVKKEYFANNPTRALLNKGIAGGIKYFSKNQDGSGIFDFIWVYREKEVGSGYYMITENDPEWDNLTEAQKAYVKKAKEIMHEQWRQTMANSYVKTSDNRILSKAEAMGYPEVLPEDFMPRIAMGQEEMLEHYPLLSKETLDYQYKKALGSFLDDPSYNVISDTHKENYNVAVKYMGNNTVIAKQNHSFNAHEAIKLFTKNLINKQEMDNTVAVAEGVIHYLQDIGYKRYNNPEYFKKAQEFILNQILIQAKEERKETALTRKNIRIPGTNKEINAEKAMANAKSWVSGATMWFQPVSGTFNGFLIFLLNLKEAVINDLTKIFGNDYSKYGKFGLKEFLWAINVWGRMQFSSITNDEEGKKLKEFAKMLNYLPDNYDYAIRKKNSVVGKNKLMDSSHLYFFHQIGEDFGTFTILASQLKTIKTVDKNGNIISMWDAYEFDETGKLVYIGGKRGVNTKGEEIKGLTSEEISRMKEVSRAIHGAYRTEEKTAMELTALGQWVMQFRKFVPTQILNAYGSMYKSTFKGYYEYKGKNEKGEDIYEWQNNIVEGRLRTFLKVIFTAIRLKNDPNYRWTNLSYEQKRNLVDITVTSLFFVLALASMSIMFDDDDEDTQAYKRMYKLALDLTTSYHPLELLNNITNFTAVLNKGKTAVKGFGSFLLEGLIEGKEAAPGVPKGLKPTLRHIPLVNGWYQIQLFLYNDKALTNKEKESWFDRWSFDEGR